MGAHYLYSELFLFRHNVPLWPLHLQHHLENSEGAEEIMGVNVDARHLFEIVTVGYIHSRSGDLVFVFF